jgi:D-alanyl-D-alanine carboxypeptidase (penicillin-binding protein 5/6)
MPPRRPVIAVALTAALCCAIQACVMSALAAPASGGRPAHTAAPAAALAPPRGIAAAAAELANAATGRAVWGRARYGRRPIASITKVMTALVVIRSGRLGRRIRISQAVVSYVRNTGASSAGLRAGDVLTAQQLLEAMLLPSGADAALALADAYGPGWPAFVRRMNALARRLGLHGTHFVNVDGLASGDISTPANLIRLGQAAMKRAAFRDIVRRRFVWLPAGRRHHHYLWRNTNLLLAGARDGYPGVFGIKTGWTPAAGQCLLFEAGRGKRVLIGVVLDSSQVNGSASFRAGARLLAWGFAHLGQPGHGRHRRHRRSR